MLQQQPRKKLFQKIRWCNWTKCIKSTAVPGTI